MSNQRIKKKQSWSGVNKSVTYYLNCPLQYIQNYALYVTTLTWKQNCNGYTWVGFQIFKPVSLKRTDHAELLYPS
jgi:hypothetical protein